MDNFHGAMVPEFERTATIATTVISRPPGRIILDAGSKSVGGAEDSSILGSGLPVDPLRRGAHAFESSDDAPALGDVVTRPG